MNPHLQMSSSLPPFSYEEHAKQHHFLPLIASWLFAFHKKQNLESFVLKAEKFTCCGAKIDGLVPGISHLVFFKRTVLQIYQKTAEYTSHSATQVL